MARQECSGERHLARPDPATQRARGRHRPVHAGRLPCRQPGRSRDTLGPRTGLPGAGFPLPWVAGGDSLCSLARLAPDLLFHRILEQLDAPGCLLDGEMRAGRPNEGADGPAEGALRKRQSHGLRASVHGGLPGEGLASLGQEPAHLSLPQARRFRLSTRFLP